MVIYLPSGYTLERKPTGAWAICFEGIDLQIEIAPVKDFPPGSDIDSAVQLFAKAVGAVAYSRVIG